MTAFIPTYAADAINVHSGSIQRLDDGTEILDEKTRRRVDVAVELFNQGKAPIIILNGGPGAITMVNSSEGVESVTGNLLYNQRPALCDFMFDYAHGVRSVPTDRLYIQPWSLDTVTEAFNTHLGFFIPLGIEREIFVSNKKHQEPRVRSILELMTGPGVTHIASPGAWTGFDEHPRREEFEGNATRDTMAKYAGITPGDTVALEAMLRANYHHAFLIPNDCRASAHRE